MYNEANEGERVVVEHDSSSVTYHFGSVSKENCTEEDPSAMFDALRNSNDKAHSIECQQCGIRSQRWSILIYAGLDGTDSKSAVFAGPVGNVRSVMIVRHFEES